MIMSNEETTLQQSDAAAKTKKHGIILLVSGELDKAILAFEIAAGFQAMGMEMSMWFVLYGGNCLRKPRSLFSLSKWFDKLRGGPGRKPETDVALQRVVYGLNHEGASNLPLSQLNYCGVGPMIFRHILRRKGMAQLEDLILGARDLGVRFTICQICVDAMAFSVPDDLIVEAEVKGVSAYYLEVEDADYNITL
jgi:peroxiredoxin family protein